MEFQKISKFKMTSDYSILEPFFLQFLFAIISIITFKFYFNNFIYFNKILNYVLRYKLFPLWLLNNGHIPWYTPCSF